MPLLVILIPWGGLFEWFADDFLEFDMFFVDFDFDDALIMEHPVWSIFLSIVYYIIFGIVKIVKWITKESF